MSECHVRRMPHVEGRSGKAQSTAATVVFAVLAFAAQYVNLVWDWVPSWLVVAALVGAGGAWVLGFERAMVVALSIQIALVLIVVLLLNGHTWGRFVPLVLGIAAATLFGGWLGERFGQRSVAAVPR